MKEEWIDIFEFYAEERNRLYINEDIVVGISGMTEQLEELERKRWERIEQNLKERNITILHSNSKYRVLKKTIDGPYVKVFYQVCIQWKLRQGTEVINQSWTENRYCLLRKEDEWWIVEDVLIEEEGKGLLNLPFPLDAYDLEAFRTEQPRSSYDRKKAVEYAERWWNDYNPKFRKFEVDCTNFISQCLWAGGAPMNTSSDRTKGWWYRFNEPVNWSFSWAVAHSLRWYLPTSQSGLRAKEVQEPQELELGDVICYDFNGDGRWQHSTIVVKKDQNGMPLVNAHTTNSRHRYWDYQDSYAWTDKTKYKFFHIL